jgi:hypothetical protein
MNKLSAFSFIYFIFPTKRTFIGQTNIFRFLRQGLAV